MATRILTWMLKPLPIPNVPYKASIVAEHLVNGEWVSIYSTTDYNSVEYYKVPVTDPSGNYRVTVDINFYGRVTKKLSNVINFESITHDKELIAYNGGVIDSKGPNITNVKNAEVVRTTPKKIQYEAFEEETLYPVMRGIIGTATPSIIKQAFSTYTADDATISYYSKLLNISKSTKITRQNGSSIGN